MVSKWQFDAQVVLRTAQGKKQVQTFMLSIFKHLHGTKGKHICKCAMNMYILTLGLDEACE